MPSARSPRGEPDTRRRLRDTARLLPLAGALAMVLPLLWRGSDLTWAMTPVLIYLFAVWIGLIIVAALLARGLSDPPRRSD